MFMGFVYRCIGLFFVQKLVLFCRTFDSLRRKLFRCPQAFKRIVDTAAEMIVQ